MKSRKLSGIKYHCLDNGIMVPAHVMEQKVAINTPNLLLPYLADFALLTQETVLIFTLDGHSQAIKRHQVTLGLANQSQIHPRESFKPAIFDSAVSIIMAHNHPSGYLQPSEADLKATKRLAEAGKLLGIPLLDHVIFHGGKVYSIREFYPELFGGI